MELKDKLKALPDEELEKFTVQTGVQLMHFFRNKDVDSVSVLSGYRLAAQDEINFRINKREK